MTPDWTAIGIALIATLQATLASVVVWGTKKLLPKIPRAALPIIAIAAGIGVEALLAYTSGTSNSPLVGAACGALAVWLHEVKTTVQQHGTQP